MDRTGTPPSTRPEGDELTGAPLSRGGLLRGSLDSPSDGAAVAGICIVRGWAMDGHGSVPVEVEVDGRAVAGARLGEPRPDVAAAFGEPRASLCGWQCVLDLDALAPGRDQIRLAASACGDDGARQRLGAVRVQRAPSAEPPDPAIAERAAELRRRFARLVGASPLPARSRRARTSDRPLRLAVFMHNLHRGGSQLIVLERLRELIVSGAASAVVVSPSDGALREPFEAMGVECHLTDPLTIADEVQYESRLAELALWVRAQACDLVLANTLSASAAVDLAGRLGLPSVWLVYERPIGPGRLSQHLSFAWPVHAQRQARAALRSATAIVFDSHARRTQYAEWAPAERLITIPGAVDAAEIDRFRRGFDRLAARRQAGLEPESKLVLCLGSLLLFKGGPVLVQAFAELASVVPEARLAFVGGLADGLEQAVRRYVESCGLSERVSIEPIGGEAYHWLGMADLLVCPSDMESMPRVVLEAMAFEVPVLATPVGDLPAVIVPGRTGWLTPANDRPALARALLRALRAEPAERLALGAAASAWVRAERDAPGAAAAFLRLIRAATAS